jgi:predicted ester cyclase
MPTEDIMTTVHRFFEEVLNQGKVALLDELFAPSFLYHDPALPDVRTLEDYKRYITNTLSAFPGVHFALEEVIAEGEMVVTRWTMRGTNTGDFVLPTMRIPATGKQLTLTGMSISRNIDGKTVELWNEQDNLGGFQQLGLIPVPQPVG